MRSTRAMMPPTGVLKSHVSFYRVERKRWSMRRYFERHFDSQIEKQKFGTGDQAPFEQLVRFLHRTWRKWACF